MDSDDYPVVVADPRRQFGRPRVRNTSTEAVAGMVWAGDPVDVVGEEFGLTRHEVLTACWFEGLQGEPRYRRRWGSWANEAHAMLGGWVKPFDPDAIPDPPGPDVP